ncbi:unnamed protein product, partial [Rangifer tarandus platyrhynchus]
MKQSRKDVILSLGTVISVSTHLRKPPMAGSQQETWPQEQEEGWFVSLVLSNTG